MDRDESPPNTAVGNQQVAPVREKTANVTYLPQNDGSPARTSRHRKTFCVSLPDEGTSS
jgi:hypothetical protein